MTAKLAQLLRGATITEVASEVIYGIEYPTLDVRTRGGLRLRVFVQSDEEGNGGGFLEMEEVGS